MFLQGVTDLDQQSRLIIYESLWPLLKRALFLRYPGQKKKLVWAKFKPKQIYPTSKKYVKCFFLNHFYFHFHKTNQWLSNTIFSTDFTKNWNFHQQRMTLTTFNRNHPVGCCLPIYRTRMCCILDIDTMKCFSCLSYIIHIKGHSNNVRHSEGVGSRQCHQKTHGQIMGSFKVSSDIFGHFLYKITP